MASISFGGQPWRVDTVTPSQMRDAEQIGGKPLQESGAVKMARYFAVWLTLRYIQPSFVEKLLSQPAEKGTDARKRHFS